MSSADAKKEFEYVRYITPGVHDDTAKGGFRNYQCAWPFRQEWMGPDVTEVVHASWRDECMKLEEAGERWLKTRPYHDCIDNGEPQCEQCDFAEALDAFRKWKGEL